MHRRPLHLWWIYTVHVLYGNEVSGAELVDPRPTFTTMIWKNVRLANFGVLVLVILIACEKSYDRLNEKNGNMSSNLPARFYQGINVPGKNRNAFLSVPLLKKRNAFRYVPQLRKWIRSRSVPILRSALNVQRVGVVGDFWKPKISRNLRFDVFLFSYICQLFLFREWKSEVERIDYCRLRSNSSSVPLLKTTFRSTVDPFQKNYSLRSTNSERNPFRYDPRSIPLIPCQHM